MQMSEKSDKKRVLVFGASGLVGTQMVLELNRDESYSSVIVFVRKPLKINYPKVTEQVIDFDRLENYAPLFQGDELFICLGTTINIDFHSKQSSVLQEYDAPSNIIFLFPSKG